MTVFTFIMSLGCAWKNKWWNWSCKVSLFTLFTKSKLLLQL